MAFSLYSATVPSFQQILASVSGLIDKAEAFCVEKDLPPEEIIQARLAEDMHPFAYQVKSTVVHSVGALEGVRKGVFSPDSSTPPDTFVGLKKRLKEATAVLAEVNPPDVNRHEGRGRRLPVRLHGRGLPDVVLDPELLFPRDNGVRHPPHEGRSDREAGFRG